MLAALLTALVLGVPPPSLELAAARHGPALVSLRSGQAGSGFFVTSSGVFVCVLAEPTDELVVELTSGERRRARVLARDADGLALAEVARRDEDGLFSALGVAPASSSPAPPRADAWLLGLSVVDGRASPTIGGLRRVDAAGRWRLDLPLDAGSPILVADRVVAVVIARAGATASVAVPAARIRALVESARPRAR